MKRQQLEKGIKELINSDSMEQKITILEDMKNQKWPLRFYYKLEKRVVENGDVINNYLVAKYFGLSIEKLIDTIVASGNAEYIYKAAKEIPGANIEKLADAMIETGDAHYIYLFVKNIKDIDIAKMIDRMNASGSSKFMIDLAFKKRK